jgi:hypothetical protein
VEAAAALTLHIAALLQTGPDVPRSAARWAFVPGPGRGTDTFDEAAARLAAFEKPVVIGALNQPGYLHQARLLVLHGHRWSPGDVCPVPPGAA